jgi:hypothetical protein
MRLTDFVQMFNQLMCLTVYCNHTCNSRVNKTISTLQAKFLIHECQPQFKILTYVNLQIILVHGLNFVLFQNFPGIPMSKLLCRLISN